MRRYVGHQMRNQSSYQAGRQMSVRAAAARAAFRAAANEACARRLPAIGGACRELRRSCGGCYGGAMAELWRLPALGSCEAGSGFDFRL